MVSVRDVAENCLDVSGTISVNRDVYGYIFRDGSSRMFGALGGGDTFPATGEPLARSLRRQLELVSGRAINLCIFLVGHENDFSGVVTLDDVTKVQYCIQVMRDIYAQASLGVRRIFWRRIGVAEAGSYTIITDKPEAIDLTDDFSGPNDGIDTFWVQSILNAGGWSTVPGPCDKDAKDDMTGAVLELSGGRRFTGVLVSHEVGHYLGLDGGTDGISNLMGDDSDNDGIDSINSNSTGLTSSQIDIMRGHCSVHGPC